MPDLQKWIIVDINTVKQRELLQAPLIKATMLVAVVTLKSTWRYCIARHPRFKTPRVTRRGKYFKFLPLVLLREGGKPQHDA
jgi:hypothetical protein